MNKELLGIYLPAMIRGLEDYQPSDPSTHCIGVTAKDKNGLTVKSNDSNACQWCALGRILKFIDEKEREKLLGLNPNLKNCNAPLDEMEIISSLKRFIPDFAPLWGKHDNGNKDEVSIQMVRNIELVKKALSQ